MGGNGLSFQFVYLWITGKRKIFYCAWNMNKKNAQVVSSLSLSLSTWLNPKYKFIPEIMQLHRYWQFCLAEYLINIVAMPWIIRKSKWPIFDCHFHCIVCIKLMNEPSNQPSTEWTKVQLISCCATVCNISVPNYNLIQFKSSSWIFSLSLSLGVQRSKITL